MDNNQQESLDLTQLQLNPLEYVKQWTKILNLDLHEENFAKALDDRDPLRDFHSKFHIPKQNNDRSQDTVYMCGNSLGLQPKTAKEYIDIELEEWKTKGVEAHFNHSQKRPWLTTDEYLILQTRHLVGAEEGEVAIMNSLSVNLHLMMVPFYRPTKDRFKILIEEKPFPSDLVPSDNHQTNQKQYAVQSQITFHGFDIKEALIQLKPRTGESTLRTEDILEVLKTEGSKIALVLLPGVQYYTGQYFDIPTITKAGHKQGCIVGFDLAHAAGNIPLKLHDWNVDFACWCSYKYLNSGPGGIAGCFVHNNHAETTRPRFAGWWGHELSTRFKMNEEVFHPIPGAFGFRLSNPPVMCIAPLLASLEIFEEAGIARLRAKSLLVTGYLECLISFHLDPNQVKVITPSNPQERGCQLSLEFRKDINVDSVAHSLIDRGIVCDERKPHVIRVSPAPLYNGFHDVWKVVQIFKEVLTSFQ